MSSATNKMVFHHLVIYHLFIWQLYSLSVESRMDTRQQDGKRLPAFFKFFIPDRSNDRLKIPTAFTSYMKENLQPRALIKDRDGNVWPVTVARIEDDFFFLNGWAKYVQDNSVELGDFLVFQYDGHSVYDVKLLGHSACEKKRVAALTVKEEEEEESKEIEEDEEEEEGEEETNEVQQQEGEEETNEVLQQQEEEQRNESYSYATEMDVDSDYLKEDEDHSTEEEENDEEQEEEEDMEEEQAAKTDKTDGIVDSKSPHKGLKRAQGGMQVSVPDHAEAKEDSRRQVDPYGRDLFRSGKNSQPKNPYFVTKIRAARRNELHVPSDVVKDHNLNLPPEIILRDKQGREWSSKLKPWKDGRLWYCGGWGKLCRVNIVGYDDTCICEFKRRVGGGLYIQVHIVCIN